MVKNIFFTVLFSILVLNACSSPSNPGKRGDSKPDLVITAAEISLGEICQAGSPIVMVRAEIKNQGDAASPARNDVGLVGRGCLKNRPYL